MNVVKTGGGAEHKIRPFLKDIESFFYRRPVVYVDVGAYSGAVFREVQAVLKPTRAYLVEPNPASYARLKETVAELGAERNATCYNLALGADEGVLRLRAQDTMTRVIDPAEAAPSEAVFEIPSRRLDALAADFVAPHVSLLKIDVEGFEAEVIEGAKRLLADQAVDMIYIEAGLDPENRQQTYYREIEDRLRAHGYRLHRIYEQQHEWALDAPLLRRMNLAFISARFAEGNPLRLSKELFALRREHEALERSLGERERGLEAARSEAAAAAAEAKAARSEAAAAAAEAKAARSEGEAGAAAAERALEAARSEAAAAAAREAELARKLAAAEAEKAEEGSRIAELEAERDRAAQERAAAEARAAEAARALAAAEARAAETARSLARSREELDELRAYGRSLETRHIAMLESETWRIMEPARRAIRLLTGKRAPAAFKPRLIGEAGKAAAAPAAPAAVLAAPAADGPAKLSQSAARKTVAQLVGLATKRDYPALLAREAQFARSERLDQFFFLRRFARLLALKRLSAFDAAATAHDEIAGRLGEKHGWILQFFGPDAYLRYVIDASTALSRVGRAEEARALVDAALPRLEAPPALLCHRAEMLWPYEPAAARVDLARAAEKAPLPGPYLLLGAWLDLRIDGPEATAGALEARIEEHPQMGLVVAAGAAARGDHEAYRRWLNRHFTAQGLLAPLPPEAGRFAFEALDPGDPEGASREGPLVTVVMTTFQSAATLAYALGSIRGQTHGALEILVVDDGSTDGAREMLAEAADADPRIRVLLNDENVGTYVAKNRAIAEAKGAYVTLHDSDDWAHPERIARHVAAMEASPSLAATRSEWLRVDPAGGLHFRRWGAKFQHPNPASTFLRRGALEAAGYFDSVRYGADSEYWFRLGRIFPGQTKGLPLCLGLGAIRAESLTQSGAGAMDVENYAPSRGAYAEAYLDWHAAARPAELKLPPRLGRRPFPAPPEMVVPPPEGAAASRAPASAVTAPEFMFGISLASARTSADWGRAQELLGHTLRSVLNQSDPRFSVVICGHERPDLAELDDPRVRFMESDQGPPKNPSGFRGDKMRKRRLIGAALRARGGGYFFPLDADDLVHREVVAHALADDNRRGYLIDRGYTLDYNNRILAPIPGAWSVSFDRSCGSSAAIWFDPEDLPVDGENDPELYFNLFQSHAYWPLVAEEYDRRLDPFPFPGGVYVVNHAQNLSFRLQRKGVRVENILRAIERHRIEGGDELLAREFRYALGTVAGRPTEETAS